MNSLPFLSHKTVQGNTTWFESESFFAVLFTTAKSGGLHRKLIRYLFAGRAIVKSNHRRWSIKKVFLKISQNSQEDTCSRASLLVKLLKDSFLYDRNLRYKGFKPPTREKRKKKCMVSYTDNLSNCSLFQRRCYNNSWKTS